MTNCICGMVDQRKVFSVISSRDHYQRSSPPWISDTPTAESEHAQNQISGFDEWSCAVETYMGVITHSALYGLKKVRIQVIKR